MRLPSSRKIDTRETAVDSLVQRSYVNLRQVDVDLVLSAGSGDVTLIDNRQANLACEININATLARARINERINAYDVRRRDRWIGWVVFRVKSYVNNERRTVLHQKNSTWTARTIYESTISSRHRLNDSQPRLGARRLSAPLLVESSMVHVQNAVRLLQRRPAVNRKYQ